MFHKKSGESTVDQYLTNIRQRLQYKYPIKYLLLRTWYVWKSSSFSGNSLMYRLMIKP